MSHLHTPILLALMFLSLGLFTSCETVDGAGRDLEHAGQAVQKSSN